MRRRLLAAVGALVLALAGAVVLLTYVRGADARALEGVQTVEVLVADEVIPEGTPAADLAGLVRTELLPAKAAVEGRVIDLDALAGTTALVELQPGEQLLANRFGRPQAGPGGTVEVPDGLQEISVLLEPQRAVGGRLAAGDEVGVYLSMKLPDGSGLTHVVLHGVLVTQVQGAPAPAESGDGGTDTASSGGVAPSASLMITLAVTADMAEPVVWGMEHGTLWLSLEPEGAQTDGTTVLTPGNVYTEAYR